MGCSRGGGFRSSRGSWSAVQSPGTGGAVDFGGDEARPEDLGFARADLWFQVQGIAGTGIAGTGDSRDRRGDSRDRRNVHGPGCTGRATGNVLSVLAFAARVHILGQSKDY